LKNIAKLTNFCQENSLSNATDAKSLKAGEGKKCKTCSSRLVTEALYDATRQLTQMP
jgi:hypothetical protein